MAFGSLTQSAAGANVDKNLLYQTFGAFMAFEFCVGIYFPNIGVLKSQIVPEAIRGIMYNLFRLPLNGLVLVLLLGDVPMTQCFQLCMCLCILTFVAFVVIATVQSNTKEETGKDSSEEEESEQEEESGACCWGRPKESPALVESKEEEGSAI